MHKKNVVMLKQENIFNKMSKLIYFLHKEFIQTDKKSNRTPVINGQQNIHKRENPVSQAYVSMLILDNYQRNKTINYIFHQYYY